MEPVKQCHKTISNTQECLWELKIEGHRRDRRYCVCVCIYTTSYNIHERSHMCIASVACRAVLLFHKVKVLYGHLSGCFFFEIYVVNIVHLRLGCMHDDVDVSHTRNHTRPSLCSSLRGQRSYLLCGRKEDVETRLPTCHYSQTLSLFTK